MRVYRLIACFAVCMLLLLLLPLQEARCQNYVEYKVQINSDGSAVWIVTQFSNINATIETWQDFQQKIFNLVDFVASATHREMAVDESSLQISTTISSESKTTEYSFLWQNFSVIQGNEIIFGDVFHANNFFSQLFGDASLQVSYPSNFSIKSISPAPYERDDSAETFVWSRTQDLVNGEPNIILTSTPQTGNNGWQQYAIIGAVAAVGATLSLLGFYRFKRRKLNGKSASVVLEDASPIESEEDKVIKILKSSGGSMRQSAIVEQCRFSKAKTSQLLATLERKGNITRYKNGRDKIVNLTERVKGE